MPDDRTITMFPAEPDDPCLRDALRALPLAEPAASALPALQARLARRRRERAMRRWLPLAAAAAVCVLALLPLLRGGLLQPVASDDAGFDADTAALIAQNQVYESALRSAAFSGRALSARSALAGAELEDLIGMLDLELSAAPDADAARALWQQRLALMQELASVRANDLPDRLTADNASVQPANWRLN
jgi:hypothetical protein